MDFYVFNYDADNKIQKFDDILKDGRGCITKKL